MAKITFANKNTGDTFAASEVNEIKSVVNGIDDAVALKANSADPTFTGTVTIPTVAGTTDNSPKAASTAFVQAVIAALVASSPDALNTLNELAAALGNDANFATNVTNALAAKAATADVGNKASLTTTDKTNLVAAINEVVSSAVALAPSFDSPKSYITGTLKNTKIVGFNLAPDFYWQLAYWPLFWQDMITKADFFDKVVKPRIDQAKAMGANCIRCIGASGAVVTGVYTRANYLAAVGKVVDYCNKRGMFFYGTAHGWSSPVIGSTNINNGVLTAEIVAYVQKLAEYPNVIGVDLINEVFYNFSESLTSAQIVTYCTALQAAVKAAVPSMPITFSITTGTNNISRPFNRGNADAISVMGLCDFLDRHAYFDMLFYEPDELAQFNKPVFLGEMGIATSTDASQITRYISLIATLAHENVVGGCFFSLTEYDEAPGNQYQAFSRRGIPDRDITQIVRDTPKFNLLGYLDKIFVANFQEANTTAITTSYIPEKGTVTATSGTITVNSSFQAVFAAGAWLEGAAVLSSIMRLVVTNITDGGTLRIELYNGATLHTAFVMARAGGSLFWAIEGGGGNIATGNFAATYPLTVEFRKDNGVSVAQIDGQAAFSAALADSVALTKFRVQANTQSVTVKQIAVMGKAF